MAGYFFTKMFYSKKGTYTVESVTSGHPDKVCDQISDAILDECLRQDPLSRVAVETFGSHGNLIIGGEVTTKAKVDYKKIAEEVYKNIGYESPLKIQVVVSEQSPDIAMGVDTGGAGDQGIMYGFASDETEQKMPIAVVLSHALSKGLEDLRKSGKVKWLKPDGKTQVTFKGGKLESVLVSCQHDKDVTQKEIKKVITEKLIKPVVKKVTGKVISKDVEILVNPTGLFILGGFDADTGLTGRKIMVDTYGGLIQHGGGAFSGKDLTKVDRSAAYMARFVAKNLVANKYAKQCLVSVAYAIGRAEPLMVSAVDEKGNDLSKIVLKNFDFKPRSIIEFLELRKPVFSGTASYGHFGKDGFSWEKIVKF
jgi:S-adenosylmethionine synthetase